MKNKPSCTFSFKGVKPKTVWSIGDVIIFFSPSNKSLIYRKRRLLLFSIFFDKEEGISTDIQHQDILYIAQKRKVEMVVEKTQ